ncbi:MAG: patatin family protein [Lachnospiraceae bacterium]|nr:patatin family protein [Lachnospiraceae bacterium]
MKTGIIDIGGGFRGIYGAGVLDYCMDENISFDLAIGISAGSANIANYLAGQRGRSFIYYTDYALRKESVSKRNLIRKGCILDVEYIYGTLCNSTSENPLNFENLQKNPTEFLIGTTVNSTGEPYYFSKKDLHQDDYRILMASSAIPFLSKPQLIDGEYYFDGGIIDCIPIDKAFELGCDKVIVILNFPHDELKDSKNDIKIAKRVRKKYPVIADKMLIKAGLYNDALHKLHEAEKKGNVLVLSAADMFGVTTVSKDKEAMKKLYDSGYSDAGKIKSFIEK